MSLVWDVNSRPLFLSLSWVHYTHVPHIITKLCFIIFHHIFLNYFISQKSRKFQKEDNLEILNGWRWRKRWFIYISLTKDNMGFEIRSSLFGWEFSKYHNEKDRIIKKLEWYILTSDHIYTLKQWVQRSSLMGNFSMMSCFVVQCSKVGMIYSD